ncbi:hypothetical protein GCM10027418_03990 [Mariniluteicoccus endophyticus]
MSERRVVTKAMRVKYAKGSRAEKGEVLDALCQATGWHRDHARKALRTAIALGDQPPPQRRSRPPAVKYDDTIIEALRVCWAVLDGPTGKRLGPALPQLVTSLRAHGELDLTDDQAALLCGMSPATNLIELARRRGPVPQRPNRPRRLLLQTQDQRPLHAGVLR